MFRVEHWRFSLPFSSWVPNHVRCPFLFLCILGVLESASKSIIRTSLLCDVHISLSKFSLCVASIIFRAMLFVYSSLSFDNVFTWKSPLRVFRWFGDGAVPGGKIIFISSLVASRRKIHFFGFFPGHAACESCFFYRNLNRGEWRPISCGTGKAKNETKGPSRLVSRGNANARREMERAQYSGGKRLWRGLKASPKTHFRIILWEWASRGWRDNTLVSRYWHGDTYRVIGHTRDCAWNYFNCQLSN